MLADEEIDRRAHGGVGEAGQGLGRRDDVPDAADVGKGDQKRRFTLGAAQCAHQVRLVLVASCSEREDERVERFGRRALKQPDEPPGVFPDQGPQVRRMIGEAEKDVAGPAALKFGLKRRGRRGLEERGEAATRLGGRGKARRLDEAFSQRCGHSGPVRRARGIEPARPPRAR